jgi:Ca2+:H+ antiporter
MKTLLHAVRHTPLLWLLAFVPVVLVVAKLKPEAHTLLFVLAVLAIVPLAAMLSHATESVAAKTGDAVGGLLHATLGNLTELVIALTALRAGEYALVKASIAGAIVTNTLFMLGASFLLGGLTHHVQEYNRVSARVQAGLLFLATVAQGGNRLPGELHCTRHRNLPLGAQAHDERPSKPGGSAYSQAHWRAMLGASG